MSTNGYCLITKDKLEIYLSELGNLINKKKAKGFYSEIVIVGGASILLNYGFRTMSVDIDCTDPCGILMNDVIDVIAKKYSLPNNWINTDFIHSNSYSDKLSLYSQYFKTYGHGSLIVRTVKDEYLVAMKVVSGRKNKNDYFDIFGIINECRQNGKLITIEMIETAIVNLYGSFEKVNVEALDFAKSIISSSNPSDYSIIEKNEEQTASIIVEKK